MAEKPAAEKLDGDPQDLIRVMPAEGDRPAGTFHHRAHVRRGMEGPQAASGRQAGDAGAGPARQFAVAFGDPADGGSGRRIDEPGRLLRVRSVLQATYEQIDRAALAPEGMPRLQRQLQEIRRELESAVSPALAAELRRILATRDEAPSAGALRIECAVLLSWADSLVVEMLSALESTYERLPRPRAAA
jgi:hypothetical protein